LLWKGLLLDEQQHFLALVFAVLVLGKDDQSEESQTRDSTSYRNNKKDGCLKNHANDAIDACHRKESSGNDGRYKRRMIPIDSTHGRISFN